MRKIILRYDGKNAWIQLSGQYNITIIAKFKRLRGEYYNQYKQWRFPIYSVVKLVNNLKNVENIYISQEVRFLVNNCSYFRNYKKFDCK